MGVGKPYKVMVLGLPKTGTSTLAAMLRILGYQVTGPEIHFKKGDLPFLKNRFEEFEGFQDYPWCFEWSHFVEDSRTRFIILKRPIKNWWSSFLLSYGKPGKRYLSYSYMGIEKVEVNQSLFLDYFEQYYQEALALKEQFPDRVLSVDIQTFGWEDLCAFLNEPIPRDFFGRTVKKPQVNIGYNQKRTSFTFRCKTRIRSFMLPYIGEKNWHRILVFLRKQGLYGG